jgi:hypothetical protein
MVRRSNTEWEYKAWIQRRVETVVLCISAVTMVNVLDNGQHRLQIVDQMKNVRAVSQSHQA